MDVFIKGISLQADDATVHDHIRNILHQPPLSEYWTRGYPMNFALIIHRYKNRRSRRRWREVTTGILTIPDVRLIFTESNRSNLDPHDIMTLLETPYRDPEMLRERVRLEKALGETVPITTLQFGWLDRDQVFSPEWVRNYGTDDPASVAFLESRRAIAIQEKAKFIIGRYTPRQVVVRFGSVESLSHSRAGDPYVAILFTLHSPPMFEEQEKTDPTARDDIFGPDEEEKWTRCSSLHDLSNEHTRLAPFVSLAFMITFNTQRDREAVIAMCRAAHLPKPQPLLARPSYREHFTALLLSQLEDFISSFTWPIAFQLSALLYDLTISARELYQLREEISALVNRRQNNPYLVAEMIVEFGEQLRLLDYRNPGHSVPQPESNLFLSYHANVTPTSIIPRGPYPDQSNRVLRRYHANNDSFIRVNFSDEARLEFRFERGIDGEKFVRDRVGTLLKNGISVAGRRFDFLGYSNSALKEHAVWFVTPFIDAEGRHVTADIVRAGLGNFDQVIRCPARYGARMSQAFTSTNTSITIEAEEILQIPDIEQVFGQRRVIFTDGIGCCSRQTMDDIKDALEASRTKKKKKSRRGTFSAVQVRLAGNKGVLSVDYRMTDNTILVRDSMNKFIFEATSLDVEIADVFDHPKPMYLNRPLIMILETLGVPIPVFEQLQRSLIRTINAAAQSTEGVVKLLADYGLGTAFHVPSVLTSLSKRGLASIPHDDEFMHRAVNYSENDVLRSLKHKARIRVPDSWTLVGVADIHGYLREGEIFVCILDSSGRKRYLDGSVLVTRSPAIHPGDVQMAQAIGRPPPDSPFTHEDLPNCVVFPLLGTRSLPQSLGGGDLDGDLYNIVQYQGLFPPQTDQPAEYPPTELHQLPEGSQCTIDHVADFVVDFINNDRLGQISMTNLIIADNSDEMSRDERCLRLAALHSVAVDFQKSGKPAKLTGMPRKPPQKPDWSLGEIVHSSDDVYESQRALGVLFRNVELPDTKRPPKPQHKELSLLQDEISVKITGEVEAIIPVDVAPQLLDETILPLFHTFSRHLARICTSYTIGRQPLTEEECWAGTIVAKSSQQGRRADMQARMREQCSILSTMMRAALSGEDKEDTAEEWLTRAWAAWVTSRKLEDRFGAKLYGWIALGSIFDALKRIQEREQE
ncbi:RdRP-domain-containing protein [Clavulina sp. PMI_390]|nr:RdRP-domain-containing protein [Clavulina sp. PMI_390]